jgi:hypothetical protein
MQQRRRQREASFGRYIAWWLWLHAPQVSLLQDAKVALISSLATVEPPILNMRVMHHIGSDIVHW